MLQESNGGDKYNALNTRTFRMRYLANISHGLQVLGVGPRGGGGVIRGKGVEVCSYPVPCVCPQSRHTVASEDHLSHSGAQRVMASQITSGIMGFWD